ncbi:hypothetical protein ACGGAI_23945 [Streptomyces antibioticus]|uniref:hypothetical protein n=1 Tax=Streptomyces antibioticus TaxID=1890 RepID=UPI00371A1EC9
MTGPTVIVICAGEATRWGGHRGTAKHLLAPEGERLIDRTVRLAREHGAGRVLIVSKPGDSRYEVDGADRADARLEPRNGDADKFLSSRHLWDPEQRTVILYGDCWFDDDAMAGILADERREWLLWCRPGPSKVTGATSGECFAVGFWPEHHPEYEAALLRVASLWRAGIIGRCGGWETYRAMNGAPDGELRKHRMYGRYETVGGWTEDFDKPLDYERWLDRRRHRTVSVLIPWQPSPGRERARAWVESRWRETYPSWQVVIGRCPDGPWRKGLAVRDGLTRCTGSIVIVADADVWCDGVEAAVDEVASGRARWAMPHTLVRRLTEAATDAVLAGGPLDGPTAETHLGMPGGGLVALRRAVLAGVPMDPGFEGWGQEDQAWALALGTLAGPMWRGTADLVHLWHPPADRQSRSTGSPASLARYRRYQAAADHPHAMRELVSEYCTSPLEGSLMSYTYRNLNTGDEVVRARPDARLDMLPNWERAAAPVESVPAAPEDLPAERERLLARLAEIDALLQPEPVVEPEPPHAPPSAPPSPVPERPARNAPKADWQAYARTCAQDSDEEAAIDGLTKDQLIEQYGKEN